jgi:hypothetical protein
MRYCLIKMLNSNTKISKNLRGVEDILSSFSLQLAKQYPF